MIENRLKETCRKLKPAIGTAADELWRAYETSDTPQERLHMEGTIRMCALKYLGQEVDDDRIHLPPPSRSQAAGEFPLGTVYYGLKRLYPIGLRRENFVKHIGIFSITGGGKTNLCYLLLLGLQSQHIPFLVVDWKRSYRALLTLPERPNLQVYTVGRKSASPFNWNPLRGPPGVHPRTWISMVAEALEKSHISGQGVADIFIDLFERLFDEFGFYEEGADGGMYPNFYDAREELAKYQFRGRRMLWRDSCSRILRTFTFGPAAGAFNARHPIRIEDLLKKPVVIELDQELPKPLRVFFSDLILRWIHLHRLGQGETESLRHVTVLEEVHNLFPRSNIERQVTNSLENVFREIRSFGEGVVTITQHPSLLPIYVLGNCNTQVYLGLQHEDDIATAKRALFLDREDEGYLDLLAVGEGIVKIKGRTGPCYVKFPLVRVKIGAIGDDMIGPPGGRADRA